MPPLNWGEVHHYIAQEGIYFFGGKGDLGVLSNDVWCLKIRPKALISKAKAKKVNQMMKEGKVVERRDDRLVYCYFQWEKIQTQGKKPEERYAHCCHYYSESNYLVVYGGRSNDKNNPILNDLCLLRMDNFLWIKVKYNSKEGDPLRARANFASEKIGSKLFIFGGIKEDLLPSNEVIIAY